MEITYKDTKTFTQTQLYELFSSVNWLSANYSERLVAAMKNSSTVFSAWDGDKLVGLINALDDGTLTAYIHYLLIHPDYQGKGVGSALVTKMKEKYASYLYLLLVTEKESVKPFYERLGFTSENTFPMQITTL